MNDATPLPHSPLGPKVRTSGASAPQPAGARDKIASAGGAAFRALIEKLETQASALEKETAEISGPADLAGAVDHAHSSLQDALTLSDRLLEAFREAQQRAGEIEPASTSSAAVTPAPRGDAASGGRTS